MKAKYIGAESAPGTQETVVFGIRVKCGQVFDVPPQFERKAQINPWFEIIEDEAPAQDEPTPAPKSRKRKDKDNEAVS